MEECLPPRVEHGTLRKSAFSRTNLFLKTASTIYREVRSSTISSSRQSSASIFHAHGGNAATERPTNCVCWHCCHAFDGVGFRLPRIFDPADQIYHVYGWYCSANCAKAYILEHSTFDRGYQMNIFVRMLRDVYGINESINEAPPRTALAMFGGPFDIAGFRAQKNVCFTVTPPFVSHSMLIEERQPIGTVDMESETKTRGTVRGLRRPVSDATIDVDQDMGAPATSGLYASFLKDSGGAASSSTDQVDEPPTKRPRPAPVSAKKAIGGGGLAKFAATKPK